MYGADDDAPFKHFVVQWLRLIIAGFLIIDGVLMGFLYGIRKFDTHFF